jgi:hypothetical protein
MAPAQYLAAMAVVGIALGLWIEARNRGGAANAGGALA